MDKPHVTVYPSEDMLEEIKDRVACKTDYASVNQFFLIAARDLLIKDKRRKDKE